jgi:hypothetical protein
VIYLTKQSLKNRKSPLFCNHCFLSTKFFCFKDLYNASDPSNLSRTFTHACQSMLYMFPVFRCSLSSHKFFCYSAKFNKTKKKLTRIIKTWHNVWVLWSWQQNDREMLGDRTQPTLIYIQCVKKKILCKSINSVIRRVLVKIFWGEWTDSSLCTRNTSQCLYALVK